MIVIAQTPPSYWGGRGGSGWVGGSVSLGGWVGCLVLRQPQRDPPTPPPPLVSKGLFGAILWYNQGTVVQKGAKGLFASRIVWTINIKRGMKGWTNTTI